MTNQQQQNGSQMSFSDWQNQAQGLSNEVSSAISQTYSVMQASKSIVRTTLGGDHANDNPGLTLDVFSFISNQLQQQYLIQSGQGLQGQQVRGRKSYATSGSPTSF